MFRCEISLAPSTVCDILAWWSNYKWQELLRECLQERKMRVAQKIIEGIPQGSVLEPLVWNVYANDKINPKCTCIYR